MTLQYAADPQMDELLKMTNAVVMKIKQHALEIYQ
jgi:hypothetical protein